MRKDHAPLSARTGDLGQNSRLALHLWLSTKHLGPGLVPTAPRKGFVCVLCLYVCICITCVPGALGGQKRELDLL